MLSLPWPPCTTSAIVPTTLRTGETHGRRGSVGGFGLLKGLILSSLGRQWRGLLLLAVSPNPKLQIDRLPDLLQSGTALHQPLADKGSQSWSIDNTKT